MRSNLLDSDLLNFIVEQGYAPGDQLPPLSELSERLEINIGKLREQLEVARTLGLVEVRPRTGIRLKPYEFLPAIRLSVLFALALQRDQFMAFTELRNHIEAAFWFEACETLSQADLDALQDLINRAFAKLNRGEFIEIPHLEHRKFHMGIFAHIDNPFVKGLLEAYWEAYEAVELNTYSDLHYWQEAWNYHQKILDHIARREFQEALEAFIAHTRLFRHRNPHPNVNGVQANGVAAQPTQTPPTTAIRPSPK
jgi:DNA-binding FadR family transcriptional regulator